MYASQHLIYGTTVKYSNCGEFLTSILTALISSIREAMTTSTSILYAVYGMIIASEILIFFGFIWAYLHSKWSNLIITSEFNIEAFVQITEVLNLGSAFVSVILQNILEGSDDEIGFDLETLTMVGVFFIFYQGDEYNLSSVFMNSYWFTLYFYVLTGLHSLHVCLGIIIILAHSFFYEGTGSTRDEDFNIGTYWHFVELIWVALTALLFLN